MKMEAIVTTVRIYIRMASVKKLSIVLTSALTAKKLVKTQEQIAQLMNTYID